MTKQKLEENVQKYEVRRVRGSPPAIIEARKFRIESGYNPKREAKEIFEFLTNCIDSRTYEELETLIYKNSLYSS